MSDSEDRSFGIVGLGRIGGGLAEQALERGFRVVGHDRREPDDSLLEAGLEFIPEIGDFADRLELPRVVFLYVPAGPVVDAVLDDLAPVLDEKDVVVDGGNSYWGDSLRRHARMRDDHGIELVDCGTSGGVRGARDGACFMAGGTANAFELAEPILAALSVDGGYVHCGSPGAGHFVKLVHNGIEFGMLQAIGEGMQLLESYRRELPVADILRTWTNGSVIRSWLVELMEEEYRAQGGTEGIPDFVEDTGEVDWLVDDAMRMEVPIPVITQSVVQLLASRDRERTWARSIAMMRHGFGEHPYGPDSDVARHRSTSRMGGYPEERDPGSQKDSDR